MLWEHDILDTQCSQYHKRMAVRSLSKLNPLAPCKLISKAFDIKATLNIAMLCELGDRAAMIGMDGHVSFTRLDCQLHGSKLRNACSTVKLHEAVVTDMKMIDNVYGHFITSSADRTVKIWSRDFQCLEILATEGDKIKHVAVDSFSKNMVATGCQFGKVKIWDINSGILTQELNISAVQQDTSIEGLDYRPESNVLAICSNKGFLRLVDKRDLKKSIFLEQIHKDSTYVRFSKNDKDTLLTSSADNDIKVWNLRMMIKKPFSRDLVRSQQILTFSDHETSSYIIRASFFGNDQYIMAYSQYNRVYLYSLNSGKVEKVLFAESQTPSVAVPLTHLNQMAIGFASIGSHIMHVALPHDSSVESDTIEELVPIPSSAEIRDKRIAEYVGKNSHLMMRINRENDVSSPESLAMVLEDLSTSPDPQLRKFSDDLFKMLTDTRPIPQAELRFIANQAKKKLFKLLCPECRVCRSWTQKYPWPVTPPKTDIKPNDFERNSFSTLSHLINF